MALGVGVRVFPVEGVQQRGPSLTSEAGLQVQFPVLVIACPFSAALQASVVRAEA